MVFFSAFLVTHFFAEANRRARLPSVFHPSAEIRLHNLVRTIASNLLDEYPETQGILGKCCPNSQRWKQLSPVSCGPQICCATFAPNFSKTGWRTWKDSLASYGNSSSSLST